MEKISKVETLGIRNGTLCHVVIYCVLSVEFRSVTKELTLCVCLYTNLSHSYLMLNLYILNETFTTKVNFTIYHQISENHSGLNPRLTNLLPYFNFL